MNNKDATIEINELVESGKIVIEDFFSDSCVPCKQLLPLLEEIAEKEADVELVKCDLADNSKRFRDLGVRTIPTLYFYSEKGQGMLIGTVPVEEIMEVIERLR